MESLQTKLDVIANNLANVNTTGFKKGRANMEDLFYRHYQYPGSQDQQGNLTATGTSVGLGTRVQSIQTAFGQGAFQQTNGKYDVAIEGDGFFVVDDPVTNQPVYTRAGNFSVNSQQQLVLGSAQTGRLLSGGITIPQNAISVTISSDGQVLTLEPGQTQATSQGQIELAIFVNPEGLLKLGENLYMATSASGDPQSGNPGTDGRGVLKQGFLEASNVEPVQELIDLITTQRSFELNSQSIQVGDDVLQLIANLRRP
jgi:flagellar basal-body rod protein FlgG